jgi:hypothetical protein
MKCVVSQQLVRVTVTLIFPVSQEFLVTWKAVIEDRQSAGVNDCDRSMRQHCSGCSAGFRGTEREIAGMRAWFRVTYAPIFVLIVRRLTPHCIYSALGLGVRGNQAGSAPSRA